MNTRNGRQRRKLVSPDLVPRSMRPLEEAFALAGLPMPGSAAEASESYLRLLVAGLEHEDVGTESWINIILFGAPKDTATA